MSKADLYIAHQPFPSFVMGNSFQDAHMIVIVISHHMLLSFCNSLDCIFLGSKTTSGNDCSHEIKRRLLLGSLDSKVSAYNSGDPGSIPGSGRSPGEGNGNQLQYSCLENPMDWGAWWATVHGVTKSWTQLSDFSSPAPWKKSYDKSRQSIKKQRHHFAEKDLYSQGCGFSSIV